MAEADDVRKLVYAITKFLKSQLSDGGLSGECAEGVEVGIQCLEAAYNIDSSEPSLEVPSGLKQIFQKYLSEIESEKDASPEEKALAERLKNQGNEHMNMQMFQEALACYTKAINLDPKNAVYYCNRAAASNRLGNYESAIQDCKTALKYDPSYSKAYGRLGLAYASMNKHQEAVMYYKKAVELEPENENHKTNLRLAEEALSNVPPAAMNMQNLDLATIFSNPNLLSMASQMLSDPSMQNMMSSIFYGGNPEAGSGGGGIEVLLQASRDLAQQMESENPQLVEQLRRHMTGQGGGGDAPNSSGENSQDQDHKHDV